MAERGHINHTLKRIFIKESNIRIKSKLPYVTREPLLYISNKNTPRNKNLFIHVPHYPSNPTPNKLRNIMNTLKEESKKR